MKKGRAMKQRLRNPKPKFSRRKRRNENEFDDQDIIIGPGADKPATK